MDGIFAFLLLVYAVIGLALCLIAHALDLVYGTAPAFQTWLPPALCPGWLLLILIATVLGGYKRLNLNLVFSGCPSWLRSGLYFLAGYGWLGVVYVGLTDRHSGHSIGLGVLPFYAVMVGVFTTAWRRGIRNLSIDAPPA